MARIRFVDRVPSIVRRRAWIIAACLIGLPAAVYLYSARLTTIYEAQVVAEPRIESSRSIGAAEATGAAEAIRQIQLELHSVGHYASDEQTLERMVDILDRPPSAIGSLGASADSDTGWITLTVGNTSPEVAVVAANAFARALDETITAATGEIRRGMISERKADLKLATGLDERVQIERDLRLLRAFEDPQGLRVIEPAVSARVRSPNPGRNAGLAAALALLLAPVLTLLAELVDRSVRRVGELERLAGTDVLAVVDDRADKSEESFRMLRDLLRHSEASESLDVLAVISPLNGDDSANVAAGLARALASAGSDVVVVDADFRGSLLAGVFGVADRPGLADLLEGLDASVALRDVDCPDGRLRVLPAGAVDAAAEHRLRSERLAAVIDAIAERCDVVVIDTPPLLLTGDALAVLTQASGVVGVFELGATPRGAVRKTREMVASAGGHLLGAVTTGQPG